jgi:threonine-phosphate decarboxylase
MNKSMTPAFHGSDLEQIAAYYHIPQESIISFGANVNPLGISPLVKAALCDNLDIITRYPDRDYKALRETIASYCDVNMEHVVVGNGSTELISLLISQRKARHALVIGPTYSEYERELSLTGGSMSYYNLNEQLDFQLDFHDFLEKLTPDIDFLILCNPNNPTSSALTQEQLTHLLSECQKRNIFVMIDETYVEFAPCVAEITAMPLTEIYDNLMIIRGVSKFYAAPGLRLGYGVTSNREFLADLRQHQNPWSLNSIAAFAGEIMLKDTSYIKKTRTLILSERERLCNILRKYPSVKIYEPYANFILLHLRKEGLTSHQVFEHSIRQGMMIRDCSSFESLEGEYIRFCIMKPDDNTRLVQCLGELL